MAPLTPDAAEALLFASYMRARPRGLDERSRHPELTAELLATLDHPEQGLPCLLVAGSKGKGSTAAFAARLLQSTGARVGLLTSPHLLNVRERIRVDGRAIDSDSFVQAVERLATAAREIEARLSRREYLSPTGLLLCTALTFFRERSVDLAVIEAGRGARFDDTRLVDHPVAALTPITREHPGQLGRNLANVAWHKAGAVSPAGAVVSAPQRRVVLDVLQAEAQARGATLEIVGREVKLLPENDGVTIETPRARYEALRPQLLGHYQWENLALALAGAEQLRPPLCRLPAESIREAVAQTRWPGRCERLQDVPLVLVDGATNALAGSAFLQAALPFSKRPITLVTAVPADKDFAGLCRVLGPFVDQAIVTRASNPHLRFSSNAAALAARFFGQVAFEASAERAIESALRTQSGRGAIWIVGTQSLVADALRLWRRDLASLW